MSMHFEMLGNFKVRVSVDDIILTNNEDKNLVLSMALKCADIGHSAK